MPQSLGNVIHRGSWNGHLVEVVDNGDYRSLYFGSRSLQSRMSLSCPYELVLTYTQFMLLSLLIKKKPQNILIVGIGSGSFMRFFHHHLPECRIDAVDNSQHIINVARGYFQLPEDRRITVHCEDGYKFLRNYQELPYDLILVDAFDKTGMAASIYSDQFFKLCADNLSPDGAVSCNVWSGNSRLLQETKKLLSIHFISQISLPVTNRGNIIVISLHRPIPWPDICLKEKKLRKFSSNFGFNFKDMVTIAKQNNLSLAKKIAISLRSW